MVLVRQEMEKAYGNSQLCYILARDWEWPNFCCLLQNLAESVEGTLERISLYGQVGSYELQLVDMLKLPGLFMEWLQRQNIHLLDPNFAQDSQSCGCGSPIYFRSVQVKASYRIPKQLLGANAAPSSSKMPLSPRQTWFWSERPQTDSWRSILPGIQCVFEIMAQIRKVSLVLCRKLGVEASPHNGWKSVESATMRYNWFETAKDHVFGTK